MARCFPDPSSPVEPEAVDQQKGTARDEQGPEDFISPARAKGLSGPDVKASEVISLLDTYGMGSAG